jgi:hypothetical protein
MNDTPQQPPDPADQRQRDVFDEASRTLRDTLPPPIDDTPEARARRDRFALAEVVALAPANLAEGGLATHCVLAMAHSDDCLRLAAQHADDPKIARRLHAQAASMERMARDNRALLLKVQAERRKRQANEATREADARTEQYVLRQMTEALKSIQAKAVPPAAAPEPKRHGPSHQPDRPLNLRLWRAPLHAGPPKPVDRTIH